MKKVCAFIMACALLFVFSGCRAADLLSGFLSSGKQKAEYDNPVDEWRNEQGYASESEARKNAINWLLSTADSGDRSAFAGLFAQVIANKESFSAQVDSFFEAYPKGFSECELNRLGGTGGSSFEYGDVEHHWTDSYTCFLDGEWYYIHLSFCYQNTKAPDEVGITFFSVENLEAFALDESYSEDVVCRIADESQVTARLINGRGFVFEPSPERSVTLEQMQDYLEKCDNMQELTQLIGEPNVTKKYSNATGCDYYYELASDDGSPLYAYIVAGYLSGEIYFGHVCSDEKILYNVTLIEDS
ncbi:MAG: DUF5104 domain-containing protein [Oscillospiraceae bacterium]|nr:DUF5104 domain-containing protein [Oscillospiraceae bacterium]